MVIRPVGQEAVAIDRREQLARRAAAYDGHQGQYESEAYQHGTHQRHSGGQECFATQRLRCVSSSAHLRCGEKIGTIGKQSLVVSCQLIDARCPSC
jgi:hypothetical protein